MDVDGLRGVFEAFCEKNDFQLNSDKEHADMAMQGVLENEGKTGLRYCPCQVRTEDFSKDIGLLCPCNFKTQKTWEEKGQCWCGLFVKK
jgi:ferredoxin-thioredoxin reductase catalytic subunit